MNRLLHKKIVLMFLKVHETEKLFRVLGIGDFGAHFHSWRNAFVSSTCLCDTHPICHSIRRPDLLGKKAICGRTL